MLRRTVVGFSRKLRDWDGFGVNYVEASQTRDVDDEGHYAVEQGYYFYKQVCRAGQPGMAVAWVQSNDSEVSLIAFASNGTVHPDAFVVLNLSDETKDLEIEVVGSKTTSFGRSLSATAYRSSDGERYAPLGAFATGGEAAGAVAYQAPPRSVTTFYGGLQV